LKINPRIRNPATGAGRGQQRPAGQGEKCKAMKKITNVVINQMDDDLYHIYDESGQAIETDFSTEQEAEEWATLNGYNVVCYFIYS
jgi:hypothetical protein